MTDELEKLKALLWQRWDPIGVNETDCPNDEYDSYALRIFSMLKAGASEGEIADYLSWAQTENMGMSWSDIHHSIAAEAMRIHRQRRNETRPA